MDDPNITMEEYVRLGEEKARKRGKVFNWETAKYGQIWYDEDIHDLISVETEFPVIAFNDGVSSKTLSCEPTVSSLNDEIDSRISFDDSDDEDYTSEKDNDDNEVDIIQSSRGNEITQGMLFYLIMKLYVPFGIPFDPKRYYKDGIYTGLIVKAKVNKARGAQIHWGSLFGKSQFKGVTDWYQSQGYREPVVMSFATSVVTYTSVYTNSEPGRAFWGADDEEISKGGIPRVIVLGYDGLPMQPIALPSPDYIPGLEDPHTPPVPQDEDERELMFVQAHDPDYVPEPIYPEYIPLEDEHGFPAEEQPLPPVDSPTAKSPGYVTESDPEEYEHDETEDGPVDYPMDGGNDGDDDDGDSSRDDANDEDKDDKDEEDEEEGYLALADSAIVVPVDEHVIPPEGTEPIIPPPSTDITIGAKITVRPQTSISLTPEAEVERLLAMTTPSPSPPISLLPPSAGECLARISSTQALINAVTAASLSPPLPPLPPSLYIPPPVDRKDDIPESEQPPRKRLYLSTLGSRYEVGESSTARPTRGRGIDYGIVSMVDAEKRR
ncbi:hypothetical protein Tco_1076894 [Tanacetum coccineum]